MCSLSPAENLRATACEEWFCPGLVPIFSCSRVARGELVSPSDYYLRTAPFFETSSAKYSWLNKIVSIGVGERQADGVQYELYEIL